MTIFEIRIDGCDDRTLFRMNLTQSEAVFLAEVARGSESASDCGCQPRLSFAPYEKADDFDPEWDSEPALIKRARSNA